MSIRILAFIQVYNEADIIGPCIEHVLSQGLDVYILDNWSTDATARIAQSYPLAGFEVFPARPTRYWSLGAAMDRVAFLAQQSGAAWCVHYDADEWRRSPRPGETLAEGIERIDRAGYNAINHQLLTFHPVDDGFTDGGNPEEYFRHFSTMDLESDRIRINAWKNAQCVQLLAGGHIVNFPGINVAPEMFVIKHYPLRSQAHGLRKVRERKTRFEPLEHRRGWHVHYDALEPGHDFLRDPRALKHWDGPLDVLPFPLQPCGQSELIRIRRFVRPQVPPFGIR